MRGTIAEHKDMRGTDLSLLARGLRLTRHSINIKPSDMQPMEKKVVPEEHSQSFSVQLSFGNSSVPKGKYSETFFKGIISREEYEELIDELQKELEPLKPLKPQTIRRILVLVNYMAVPVILSFLLMLVGAKSDLTMQSLYFFVGVALAIVAFIVLAASSLIAYYYKPTIDKISSRGPEVLLALVNSYSARFAHHHLCFKLYLSNLELKIFRLGTFHISQSQR